VLDRVYVHDYIFMVILVLLFYVRHDHESMRLTFVSISYLYLFSILLTAAFPSYGPCFMKPERYRWVKKYRSGGAQASLRNFFEQVSLPAEKMEVVLPARAFVGIAAFPSLHVGHMVALAVVGFREHRIYSVFMCLMAFVTFLATMAFGWHYAVDGIGGTLLAIAFPLGLRRLIERWDAQRQSPHSSQSTIAESPAAKMTQ
jgi:membrane-associated phospholipid phosphatase